MWGPERAPGSVLGPAGPGEGSGRAAGGLLLGPGTPSCAVGMWGFAWFVPTDRLWALVFRDNVGKEDL